LAWNQGRTNRKPYSIATLSTTNPTEKYIENKPVFVRWDSGDKLFEYTIRQLESCS